MRVLGIDPGIAKVGWGIIDSSNGKNNVVEFGCFTSPKSSDLEDRLSLLHTFIIELTQKYQPDVLSIENLYFAANSKTALTVGHARGVILLAASDAGLPVSSFTPLQIKQALTGYGRADKNQIQIMVKSYLHIKELSQDDTADALAVALTYIFSHRMQKYTDKKTNTGEQI